MEFMACGRLYTAASWESGAPSEYLLETLKHYFFVAVCAGSSLLHGGFRRGEHGPLSAAVPGFLIAAASLVPEHRLQADGLQELQLED